METTTPSKSNLSLTGRTLLSLTCVKKIRSAEPSCVIAILDNCSIIITGKDLAVQNVNIANGLLDIGGTVFSIKYSNTISKKFSIKNMFK